MNSPNEIPDAEMHWLELLMKYPITDAAWVRAKIEYRHVQWTGKRIQAKSTWTHYYWQRLCLRYFNQANNLSAAQFGRSDD